MAVEDDVSGQLGRGAVGSGEELVEGHLSGGHLQDGHVVVVVAVVRMEIDLRGIYNLPSLVDIVADVVFAHDHPHPRVGRAHPGAVLPEVISRWLSN